MLDKLSFLISVIVTVAAFLFGGPKTVEIPKELQRDSKPKKYVTISFDDGITQDLKIMEICRKYGFDSCTFNVNTGLCGANWDWVGEAIGDPSITHQRFTRKELKSGVYDGFDVAVHTLNHPSMKAYDDSPLKLMREINVDAANIYRYTGFYPLGMAWPGGDTEYTDKTVDLVAKYTKMGFARGVTSTYKFELPEYFLKWYPTCTISDPRSLELTKEFIDADCEEDMLLYLWCHGYEFELNNGYEKFEEIIKLITEADDVVPVTNSEFYLLFADEIPRWK